MTTTNTTLARAVCTVGLALSAMPLDDLPQVCAIEFDEHNVGEGYEPRVSMQLASEFDRTLAGDVRALLAWQHAMPGGSSLRATRLRGPGWKITARGRLGGIRAEVWTIVEPDEATSARMVDGALDLVAAAILVESVDLAPAAEVTR